MEGAWVSGCEASEKFYAEKVAKQEELWKVSRSSKIG
jgi:hypothetical protein